MAGTKIALIVGGAGNIGSATSTAFAKSEDYKKVVMISRSQDRLDKAIEAICKDDKICRSKLIDVVADVSKESPIEVREKVVAKVGDKLDSVVAVVGWPYMNCGPMLHVTFEQLDSVLHSQIHAALGAYRTFMPMVQKSDSGAYVFVTGGGPDTYLGPGTGVMAIGGSNTQALARVVMKEHKDEKNVCCTEMSFNLGVYPDPSYAPPGNFPSITNSEAGQGLFSVASKRVADMGTLVIKSPEDIKEVISTGKLGNA